MSASKRQALLTAIDAFNDGESFEDAMVILLTAGMAGSVGTREGHSGHGASVRHLARATGLTDAVARAEVSSWATLPAGTRKEDC